MTKTLRDGLAARQHMRRLIAEALPAGSPLQFEDGDDLTSAGITSLLLLQVLSAFIEQFHVDPSLLMEELGELNSVGQLLSLSERLAAR